MTTSILGYTTNEQLVRDKKTGHLITDGPGTYKIPTGDVFKLEIQASQAELELKTSFALRAQIQAFLAQKKELRSPQKLDFEPKKFEFELYFGFKSFNSSSSFFELKSLILSLKA